jgi:hypothetical protein
MGKITNGLGVLAAGMQLLHPGHLQHPTRPVIPNNESFWITQVEDDSSTTRLTGSSLLKPSAFFNLGTAYVDYVPLEQRVREGKKEENLEFTPEQQAVYDEISAIYGLYGVDFKFSQEGVFDQTRIAGEPVEYPDAIVLETPEGKDHLLSKALTLLYALYGENIYKYINKVVYNKDGNFFQVAVGDEGELSREILLNTDAVSTYAGIRQSTLHEGMHAVDVGYKAHTVDEYLAIQLIKAKITLLLTNPHTVWSEHYASRYHVWYYNPYLQIGSFVDEHRDTLMSEAASEQEGILNELVHYADGLGSDGYLSDVDKIYVGLKAFELKQANPNLKFPQELELVLSDWLFRITAECFADILAAVLKGDGHFTDPEILALVQEYLDVIRPDDEQIALDELIYLLRFGYYENTLILPPYTRQDPQE